MRQAGVLNISWPLPSHGRYSTTLAQSWLLLTPPLSRISKYRCASQRKTRGKPALFHELVFGQWEIQPCLDSYTWRRGGRTSRIMGPVNTFRGTPIHSQRRTSAPELMSLQSGASATTDPKPQLLKTECPRACAVQQKEATAMRSPCTPTRVAPHSPQLERAYTQQWGPSTNKNNKYY